MSTQILTPKMAELYAGAFLIRAVEQRLLRLFSEGKLQGTVHTCIGQEWTGVAIAAALTEGDVIFSNHRCHGHYLARTDDVDGLIAELMGKETGVCGGRGGSQHLCSHGVYTSGIQGGIVPIAAGFALASTFRGSGQIVAVFLGDGTLGEGVVYETLNVAAKWELPLFVVLENNFYAQSTPLAQTLAGQIGARAEAFGIRVANASTDDPDGLVQLAGEAVRFVRHESQPFFLNIDTYRLMAHSKGDDHRDEAELQRSWAKDPLEGYRRANETLVQRVLQDVESRIDQAVSRAEAAVFPRCSRCNGPPAPVALPSWRPTRIQGSDRGSRRIYDALRRNLQRDDRIILLGEDIEAPYGGAFKVTGDLSHQFPGRVRNMPISEATIVGMGNGLAMTGFRPVCEIMFGDFLTLAADQIINHAAKLRYMYNEQVSVPLIIRTPMGGKRGYGPTHSQSLEKHFLGIPDTQVLAIHHRYDPGTLYDTLLAENDRLTIVIENKRLYCVPVSHKAPPGFIWEHTDELFPTSRLRPAGTTDVSILCYGGMLPDVEQAIDLLFEDHDVICEAICPIQLYPFHVAPLVESLRQSRRLLVVEEGQGFAALGSEAIAQVTEQSSNLLQVVHRLGAPPHAIASSGPLESVELPGTDQIVNAVLEMMANE